MHREALVFFESQRLKYKPPLCLMKPKKALVAFQRCATGSSNRQQTVNDFCDATVSKSRADSGCDQMHNMFDASTGTEPQPAQLSMIFKM